MMKKLILSFLIASSLLNTVALANPTEIGSKGGDCKPPIEVFPPKGDVTIGKDGENITITIENKKKLGIITIIKVDKETKKPIPGVKFVLKEKCKGKVIAEGVTDNDGKLYFRDIPLGDYYYEEVSAPKPY